METFNSRALTITVAEEPGAVVVAWRGRSTARDPAEFLLPILSRALSRACELRRPITLDFRALEYFNSSTITPVVKLVEEARRRDTTITLQYDGRQRWQELSFSALRSLHGDAESVRVVP